MNSVAVSIFDVHALNALQNTALQDRRSLDSRTNAKRSALSVLNGLSSLLSSYSRLDHLGLWCILVPLLFSCASHIRCDIKSSRSNFPL